MGTASTEAGPDAGLTHGVRTRRFSVEDYHRMIDAGILGEEDHVELLEGTLYEMTPQGEAHARVLEVLNRIMVRSLGARFRVRPQLPLTFEASEPEPDLAVVREEDPRSRDEHPRSALLVVEVSRSTLAHDRTVKRGVYARAGVPELWIVDVDARHVEVYRSPDRASGRYGEAATVPAGESVTARSVPGLSIEVERLFDW